ncbi:hypothetical protein [Kitasatospora sp. NPDC056181]|uniref:hypothetical protein n=1 Tax=Kitasatospora sp. NPDC056181 TaxID=3345737 RepID=UPI0035E06D06
MIATMAQDVKDEFRRDDVPRNRFLLGNSPTEELAAKQPSDVRVPAALAWLCPSEGPVPDDLRSVLDALVTDDLPRALDHVPWIRHVDEWTVSPTPSTRSLRASRTGSW